jgi:segregation and condensation protein A
MERIICVCFELAMNLELDPWDIDLVKFSKAYLRLVKNEESIDFVRAGRMILMAWKVLRLQSDGVCQRYERPEPEEMWGATLYDDFSYGELKGHDFTAAVKSSPEPPVKEMVWRKGKRPVTLLELIKALEEAQEESIRQGEMERKRRQMVSRKRELATKRLRQMAHRDNLEATINMTWERINRYNGHAICLRRLWEAGNMDDIVSILVSVLHLAQRKKITLWQKNFPYGDIYIKNLTRTKNN